MMSMKKYVVLLFASLLTGINCSPESGEKDGGEVAPEVPASVSTRVSVSFGVGIEVDGSTVPFSLAANDQVALIHVPSGEKVLAKPTEAGGAVSPFVDELKAAAKGDQLVLYYPADRNVEASGSKASFDFPAKQDGTAFAPLYLGGCSHTGSAFVGHATSLRPMAALFYVKAPKGAYSVTGASVRANGGEHLAGKVSMDFSSNTLSANGSATVEVTLKTPLDCTDDAQPIPIFLPPLKLSKGFTVTFSLSDGSKATYEEPDAVTLYPGGFFNASLIHRELVACGSNMVYIINASAAEKAGRYNAALLWSWDANTESATIGAKLKRMSFLDECKPVMDRKKLLLTSSDGWVALLDIKTKKVDWWATDLTQAHSAEILPGQRVVVAGTTEGLYLMELSSQNVLAKYSLPNAHGVVWSDKYQRLYAVGGTSLQIYKLKDWNGSSPALELETTLSTSCYVTGLHELSMVDESTLAIAGNKVALFDLETRKFTALVHFNSVAGMKSINYNKITGEAYYTYGWTDHSEGDYTWSTHTIRYTDAVQTGGGKDKKTITVDDINMYKVRVLVW